jgi:hypothetical protein
MQSWWDLLKHANQVLNDGTEQWNQAQNSQNGHHLNEADIA